MFLGGCEWDIKIQGNSCVCLKGIAGGDVDAVGGGWRAGIDGRRTTQVLFRFFLCDLRG